MISGGDGGAGLSSGVAGAGGCQAAGWSVPVLGEAYRGRRSLSTPVAGKTPSVVRLPKNPRPGRTTAMLHGAKDGIQECIRTADNDIGRLRGLGGGDEMRDRVTAAASCTSLATSCQTRAVEVEKHIKQAERFKKRLEFHLFKLEELEDSYVLHQQLREGVKTMARAFISHHGSSCKASVQSVERGHKECTQTLCVLEAQLESLLGTFRLTMAGLAGFARLVPGDTCELLLRYGAQKWRCRGKIGDNSQTWEPQNFSAKVLVGEVFSIRVVEVRSLGKNLLIGEKNCETAELLSARRQVLNVSLNSTGSVKLNLLVQWIPLDGVDESVSSVVADVIPRRVPVTSRRQLPIRSMIEGDGQLQSFLYWDNKNDVSAASNPNRLSMPVFPSSYTPVSTSVPDSLPTAAQLRPSPSNGFYGRRSGQPRPFSVVAMPTVLDDHEAVFDVGGAPPRAPRSQSVGAVAGGRQLPVAEHVGGPEMTSPSAPTSSLSCGAALRDCIDDVRHLAGELQEQFPPLRELAIQVDAVDELLRNNSRNSSTESVLIESALEAFSFLESEDYVCDSPHYDSSDANPATDDVILLPTTSSNNSPCTVLTMRTTDSGIGSIANRTRDRRAQSDSRLLESCRARSPTYHTDGAVSIREDLETALHWHLVYTASLLEVLRDDASRLKDVLTQAETLDQLLHNATAKESEFANVPPSGECVESFWRRLAGDRLFASVDDLSRQLHCECSQQLAATHGIRDPKYVFETVISHLLDRETTAGRCDPHRKSSDDVISRIVTLQRFRQFFADSGTASVADYVDRIATECVQHEFSLPDIVQKTCELKL